VVLTDPTPHLLARDLRMMIFATARSRGLSQGVPCEISLPAIAVEFAASI